MGGVGDNIPVDKQIDVGEPVSIKPSLQEYDIAAPAAIIPAGVATPLLNPGFVQAKRKQY